MTEALRNCDTATDALAGEDDVLAEVQDAVMTGLKPGANAEEALLRVNDAVEAREEIAAGREVLGRDPKRFGAPDHQVD